MASTQTLRKLNKIYLINDDFILFSRKICLIEHNLLNMMNKNNYLTEPSETLLINISLDINYFTEHTLLSNSVGKL